MATNLKQIADHLDISVATVSRALQNNPRISDETRHRVISAAAQMGYKPRRGATEESPVIPDETLLPLTVLAQFDVEAWESGNFHIGPVPFHGSEWSSSMNRILAGISKGARAQHLSALVHYVPLSECNLIDKPEYQPASMRTFQTTGLLLVGEFPADMVQSLSQTWPCVTIGHEYPGTEIDCVSADSLNAISQLMDALYAQGHRKIGFLNYMGHQSWAQMRYAGYIQSLSRLNLPYIPEIIGNIDDRQIIKGRELAFVLRHLHQGEHVTAWVCADDVVAYRLFEDLRNHGVQVPEELSITGFNAVQPPAGFPMMSGIRPPFGIVGALAVQSLLEHVDSPHLPPRHIMVRCERVEGETMAPPKP
ncbi:LacI family transcriptional regulator [bacterium]|nr:MAG: LacI family transcriptional regulator [bacterium]